MQIVKPVPSMVRATKYLRVLTQMVMIAAYELNLSFITITLCLLDLLMVYFSVFPSHRIYWYNFLMLNAFCTTDLQTDKSKILSM